VQDEVLYVIVGVGYTLPGLPQSRVRQVRQGGAFSTCISGNRRIFDRHTVDSLTFIIDDESSVGVIRKRCAITGIHLVIGEARLGMLPRQQDDLTGFEFTF